MPPVALLPIFLVVLLHSALLHDCSSTAARVKFAVCLSLASFAHEHLTWLLLALERSKNASYSWPVLQIGGVPTIRGVWEMLDFRTVVCNKPWAAALNWTWRVLCDAQQTGGNRVFVSWSLALWFKLSPLFSAEVGRCYCSFLWNFDQRGYPWRYLSNLGSQKLSPHWNGAHVRACV